MAEVFLHVYDVTSSQNLKANSVIVQLNKVMRDGMGVGGIFHGAIQVHDEEWSFGFCEHGSGVFVCPPKGNPMYTYRETVSLGSTTLPSRDVNQILMEMGREWQGCTYDLLARNCNHFCEVFCARLGVEKLPLWVNRFAKTGDAAVEVAGETMERLQQAKEGVVSAGRVAYRYLFGERSPTSPTISLDPELSGSSGSSRRFTFSRTPSRNVAETSSDGSVKQPTETQNGSSNGSVEQRMQTQNGSSNGSVEQRMQTQDSSPNGSGEQRMQTQNASSNGSEEQRVQTENASKVQNERSLTSLLSMWKEPSLREVEEQEPTVHRVQVP